MRRGARMTPREFKDFIEGEHHPIGVLGGIQKVMEDMEDKEFYDPQKATIRAISNSLYMARCSLENLYVELCGEEE